MYNVLNSIVIKNNLKLTKYNNLSNFIQLKSIISIRV